MGYPAQISATAPATIETRASSDAGTDTLERGHLPCAPNRADQTRVAGSLASAAAARVITPRAWGFLSAIARRAATTRAGCGLVSALVFLGLATGALAQAPGRYVQNDVQIKIGELEFRVVSADVLQDKSIRINLIITNTTNYQQITGFRYLHNIQLISDSLDRVPAVGKPEGQFQVNSEGIILLVPQEAIKVSLKFRPLPEETKRVNLVAYPDAIVNAGAINIRGIALFTGSK
jgi:hypothetical protein